MAETPMQDEREKFEAWARDLGWIEGLSTWDSTQQGYWDAPVNRMWHGWKARAELAAPDLPLTACANCLRPQCEHHGKLCPPPFTTHWHAWDYEHAQPTYHDQGEK